MSSDGRQRRATEAMSSDVWSDPSHIDDYLQRLGQVPARLAGDQMLLDVLPEAPRRLLDLGCGDGRLTALVLDRYPTIRDVVAVDDSEPMLDRAKRRSANEPRVNVVAGNMVDDIRPLGQFDVIVSGFAIHHLDDERKRSLFCEIAEQLHPGGMFANLEVVLCATPQLDEAFRAAVGRDSNDPQDRLVDVETQLQWMRAAGLQNVDCFWRWRGFALLAGSR